MANGVLYSFYQDHITLEDSIKLYMQGMDNSQDVIGFLYTPEKAFFSIPDRLGRFSSPPGIHYSTVFEARFFNEQAELRWLKEQGDHGRMVILTERSNWDGLPNFNSQNFLDKCFNQYVLWGIEDKVRSTSEWLCLHEDRIGELMVPYIPTEGNVYLKTIEYFGRFDDFGNVAVTEERLIGTKGGDK